MGFKGLIFFIFTFSFTQFSTAGLNVNALRSSIDSAVSTAPPVVQSKIKPTVDSLKKTLNEYPAALSECKQDKDHADYRCFEGDNKEWNDFSNMMGSLGDMAGMSMSSSCSKLAELLKMGQAVQTGFRAQCAMAKGTCEETCQKASKMEKDIISKLEVINDAGITTPSTSSYDSKVITAQAETNKKMCQAAAEVKYEVDFNHLQESMKGKSEAERKQAQAAFDKCAQEALTYVNDYASKTTVNPSSSLEQQIQTARDQLKNNADENSPKSLLKACNEKAQILQKTAMNVMSLMNSVQQNQACANELQTYKSGLKFDDCELKGTCPPSDPTSECSDPKYKDSVYCKSYTRNTSPNGGSGATPASGNIGTPNFELDTKGALDDLGMNGGDGSFGGDPSLAAGGGGEGTKSAGVPGGGGGGGLAIPGGGYNPKGGRSPSGSGGTEYSTSSGSSGGGSYGSSGGSSKDDMEKYLPGGEKDPTLAKKGGIEGITSPGGLTLFEKVSKSYRNNRSTLIPE